MINDSYNSDLASLDIALDFLVRRSEKKGLKRTLILSDILETGQSTATLYRRVAQLVRSRGIDKLIGVGAEISSCTARFDDALERYFFPNTEALLASNLLKSLHSEVILIKGSRVFNFDLLSEELELKVQKVIRKLPQKQRKVIFDYMTETSNNNSDLNEFYYRMGLRDGLKLKETIKTILDTLME